MAIDFLGIGAQKAGTTWLHYMLQAHSGVWLPPIKEIQYLSWHPGEERSRHRRLMRRVGGMTKSADLDGQTRAWLERLAQDDHLDLNWYRSLFADAGPERICGEICPEYAPLGPDGLARIKTAAPDAKIVFLLRHPIERYWASIQEYCKHLGVTTHDAVQNEEFPRLLNHASLVRRGLYAATLEAWEDIYGRDRVFVGFQADMDKAPLKLLEDLCAFLGLTFDSANFPEARARFNVSPTSAMPASVPQAAARHFLVDIKRLTQRFPEETEGWLEDLEAAAAG